MNNRGIAMITALVVGVVVLMFCLSMLVICYSLYAETNRKSGQIQCKEMAQSVAVELKDTFKKDCELTQFLKDQIRSGSWEASEDSDSFDYNYNMTLQLSGDGDVSDICKFNTVLVELCYVEDSDSGSSDDNDAGGSNDGGSNDGGSNDAGAPNKGGIYRIYARITCARGDANNTDQKYSIETMYKLSL